MGKDKAKAKRGLAQLYRKLREKQTDDHNDLMDRLDAIIYQVRGKDAPSLMTTVVPFSLMGRVQAIQAQLEKGQGHELQQLDSRISRLTTQLETALGKGPGSTQWKSLQEKMAQLALEVQSQGSNMVKFRLEADAKLRALLDRQEHVADTEAAVLNGVVTLRNAESNQESSHKAFADAINDLAGRIRESNERLSELRIEVHELDSADLPSRQQAQQTIGEMHKNQRLFAAAVLELDARVKEGLHNLDSQYAALANAINEQGNAGTERLDQLESALDVQAKLAQQRADWVTECFSGLDAKLEKIGYWAKSSDPDWVLPDVDSSSGPG